MEAVEGDWRRASLPDRIHSLLSFAEKAAGDASSILPEDLEPLREQGLDDEAIFDVVAVVALFAFYNTVADALGIEPEPEWEGIP